MELAPDTDEDVACCQEFATSFLTWASLSEKRVENHVSHKGATAVAASKSGGYFVAVKREGIFHYSVESGWQQLLKLKHKIHAISYLGLIYLVLVKMEQ